MNQGVDWRAHIARRNADEQREELRDSFAVKAKRDVVQAKVYSDAAVRYTSSEHHKSLGGGNYQTINIIGDATRGL